MQHLLEISGAKHRARGQNLPAKASNPTAGTTLTARMDFWTLNCVFITFI